MENEDQHAVRFIRVSQLQSIKTKLLVFALLATIVPSVTLGALSYIQNRKLLEGKIASQLRNATIQTTGEVELWLTARFYDLKVFSSSYIVSENLQRLLGMDRDNIERLVAINRVRTYLQSVRDKFTDYGELVLVNMIGEPLVSSEDQNPTINLPAQWFSALEAGRPIIGAPYWDPTIKRRVITLAEEITSSDNRRLGILATKIDLSAIRAILKRKSEEGIDELFLADSKGSLIASSAAVVNKPSKSTFAAAAFIAGSDFSKDPTEFINYREQPVMGLARKVPSTEWAVVTQMRLSKAYAGIVRLGKITLALVVLLLIAVGTLAYALGHTIVKPLERLSGQAGNVAAGDLQVDIPVRGRNEVSYLTQVFNHMVASLRRGQAEIAEAHEALMEKNRELHQLSITDGLTGLYNRKHVMDLFDMEFVRTQRYGTVFCVLIADIDHFKTINDTYGHLAGDAVLRRIADCLRQTVRETDHVGRYGGEEFLIILPATDTPGAMELGQRIRHSISQLEFHDNGQAFSMSVSVGLAHCTDSDGSVEAVISRADTALYQAKAGGRNQVIGP